MKVLNKYLTITLISLLIASSFSTAFVQVAFNVNESYIIKELCVNRFKPETKCNGKCYLKKQITENDDHQKDNNKNVVTESIHWLSQLNDGQRLFLDSKNTMTMCVVAICPQGFLIPIEHPPQA